MILSLFFIKVNAQTNDIINPKNKWFFGIEAGQNEISSFSLNESKNSIQVGLLTEYYFTKKWSLSAKLKYYKTGVSFYKGGLTSSNFGGFFSTSTRSGTFKGEVITLPLIIKWEFKIYKKFKGNLKLGYTFNKEIKSSYVNYSNNFNTNDYKKDYQGTLFGYGFNYFISNKSAIYLDVETYTGTEKGGPTSLLSNGDIITLNNLISIGFKYNFIKK
jgi:hypothetical protein